MRALLLAALLVVPVVHGQVIECPNAYPGKPAARLIGAGMYTGERGGNGELIGDRRAVKGGWEAAFGFGPEPKWLVCYYGSGEIQSWQQVDSKVTRCTLKVREGRDRTAAVATCR